MKAMDCIDYQVTMRDCDRFGRMRIGSWMAICQDASERILDDWGMAIAPMMNKGVLWVVGRSYYELESAPGCEEWVRVITWPEKTRGGMIPWQYRMETPAGEVLARASVIWVMIDAESRSMLSRRIPKLTYTAPEPPAEPVARAAGFAMPELSQTDYRTATYSETDINDHLTNTRYAEWMCDLLPLDWHAERIPRRLNIDYRAEIKPGERVCLRHTMEGNTLFCRAEGKFDLRMEFAARTPH